MALVDVSMASWEVATTALQGLWENVLLPALTLVWEFIQNNIIPIVNDLVDGAMTNLEKQTSAIQALWENVLLPALTKVKDFIADKVSPAIEKLTGFIDSAKGSFDGLTGAIQAIIDKLSRMADKLRNLDLPDWLTPGSPTPFELGLIGIGSAISGPLLNGIRAFENGAIPRIAGVTDQLNEMVQAAGIANGAIGGVGSLGGGIMGGSPGGVSNNSNVTNFNMTVNTRANQSTVTQDFNTMRALIA